jgi:hypothetical protein
MGSRSTGAGNEPAWPLPPWFVGAITGVRVGWRGWGGKARA